MRKARIVGALPDPQCRHYFQITRTVSYRRRCPNARPSQLSDGGQGNACVSCVWGKRASLRQKCPPS